MPTDGSHYWKSNLHILQSGFVKICLKYFFLMTGDFGSFCFNSSGILCEQGITLPGMFCQQYTLRQPKQYTNTTDIPALDSFAPSWFRAVLVLPCTFQHHSISNILSTSPHCLLFEQCRSLVLFFLYFSFRFQFSTPQQFKKQWSNQSVASRHKLGGLLWSKGSFSSASSSVQLHTWHTATVTRVTLKRSS